MSWSQNRRDDHCHVTYIQKVQRLKVSDLGLGLKSRYPVSNIRILSLSDSLDSELIKIKAIEQMVLCAAVSLWSSSYHPESHLCHSLALLAGFSGHQERPKVFQRTAGKHWSPLFSLFQPAGTGLVIFDLSISLPTPTPNPWKFHQLLQNSSCGLIDISSKCSVLALFQFWLQTR